MSLNYISPSPDFQQRRVCLDGTDIATAIWKFLFAFALSEAGINDAGYRPPCFQMDRTSRRHMYVPQMSPATPTIETPPNFGGRPDSTRMLEQIKTDAVSMAFVSRFAIESSVLRSGSNPSGSILCWSGILIFPCLTR